MGNNNVNSLAIDVEVRYLHKECKDPWRCMDVLYFTASVSEQTDSGARLSPCGPGQRQGPVIALGAVRLLLSAGFTQTVRY